MVADVLFEQFVSAMETCNHPIAPMGSSHVVLLNCRVEVYPFEVEAPPSLSVLSMETLEEM